MGFSTPGSAYGNASATMRLLKNLPRLACRYRRLPLTIYADTKETHREVCNA
jgi:hypothetical protein